MNNWWIIIILIAAALILHFFVSMKKSSVLAFITVFLHIGAIIMLLLLEAELAQLFVFMSASVVANSISQLLLKAKTGLKTVDCLDSSASNANENVAATNESGEEEK